MPIDPANASEIATIAREVAAEVVEGNLAIPPRPAVGNWATWTWASTWTAANCLRRLTARTLFGDILAYKMA